MTATQHPTRVPSAQATAVHAAGHAVAAVVLRLGLVSVTVVPSDECLGLCQLSFRTRESEPKPDVTEDRATWRSAAAWEVREARRDAYYRRWMRRSLVSTMAGPLAEMRIDPAITWDDDGAAGDKKTVGDAAAHLTGWSDQPTRTAFVDGVERDALALLDRTWPAVLALADALLEAGTLTAPAVRRIVAPHLPARTT